MTNFFETLGLSPSYTLDLADLEARYHERSKLHHPDRHAKADGATRVKNALATSELNQAYRALRDPTQRAEHILRINGIEPGDDRAATPVDPAFLMEIIELREALEDARAAKDEAKIAALSVEVHRRRDGASALVESGFRQFEAGNRAALPAIADALVANRYFLRFLDEIEAHHESSEAR